MRRCVGTEGQQLFRCPCCGIWCWTYLSIWRARKGPIYCENCDDWPAEERGRGRNNCPACRELQSLGNHWNDPQPKEIPVIIICMR